MPSLSQLLTSHHCLLVFDAASTQVQVGLLRSDHAAVWQTTSEEAGRGIFTGVRAILNETQIALDAIEAFVFCEGPGSMLGTRTVAMAIRTWQVLKPRPAYAYQSLAVAGHFERSKNGHRNFAVIADARRETWHHQSVGTGPGMAPLCRLPAAEVPGGELVTPEHFRAWAQSPRPAGICSYDLAKIFPALNDGDFFRAVAAPDAFQYEAPEYKKSPARIHSLLTADKK